MLIVSFLKRIIKEKLIWTIAPTFINIIFYYVPRKAKTLLLIKNDGIGDYVLFRNFLSFLKNSNKFKSYKIYVLANISQDDLAVHLDSDTVQKFYWYSDSFFLNFKIIKLILALQKLRPNTIFYTNYSRKYLTDWIVGNINAKHKIAIKGDAVNKFPESKNKGNSFYTQLIQLDSEPVHEFERNKQIFEFLTEEKCDLTKPTIDKAKLTIINHNSVVLFTGGSDNNKKWPSENYTNLCRLIILELNQNITLAGGKEEIEENLKIERQVSNQLVTNQTGRLTLIELCELIGGSKLLISNDTAAVHIAVALDIPTICIARGDLYGRFIPFPKNIYNKVISVFPKNVITENKNYDQWSLLNINEVLIEDVYSASLKALVNLQIK